MADEMVYEISRYDLSAAEETLIEQYRLYRDGSALHRHWRGSTETVPGVDPAAVIGADPDLNEVRADQLTRVTAAAEFAAVLPLVLAASAGCDSRPERFRMLYVNDDRWAPFPGPDGTNHLLPRNGPTVALAHSWVRLSFNETGDMPARQHSTELGLATPAVAVDAGQPDSRSDHDGPTIRVWRRTGTPGDDARITLSWLHGNALSDHLGIDTDMLVQLFIEAAVNSPAGRRTCDGEFLATLAGASGYVGTTARSHWSLTTNLASEVVEAVLDAIVDSSPQWRYAIIAARDPASPAGRVRATILADLGC